MGNIAKFFKSIPGIVTAAGTAVAIIWGIITHSKEIVVILFPPKPVSQLVKVLKTEHLNVLPYSLRNLVGLYKPHYLYWYDLEVENRSHFRVNVKVTFEAETLQQGLPIICRPKENNQPVDSHKILKWYPETFLDFGQRHVQPHDVLVIRWHIYEEDHLIEEETESTELLPGNTVDWDLKAPDGGRVPVDFVLASLTAWTVPPKESLAKIVEELQDGIDRAAVPSSVDRWFASCYRRFFQNPSRNRDFVQVSSANVTFPGTGIKTIHTFSEIRDEHAADSLEAALFLGALSRATYGKRLRLALFAVSESQDQPAAKTILLSWSTDSRSWRAVNLAQANEIGFADNEKLASTQVTKLLGDHPEIIPALNDPGVFIEKGQQAVALDFVHADEKFQFTSSL